MGRNKMINYSGFLDVGFSTSDLPTMQPATVAIIIRAATLTWPQKSPHSRSR